MKTYVLFVALVLFSGLVASAQTAYVAVIATNAVNGTYVPPPGSSVIVQTIYNSATVNGQIAGTTFALATGQSYAGLTNVLVMGTGGFRYASLLVTTPSSNTISNCLPADCLVIPTSQTGNVNVTLETSSDLITWTAASPGLYGPNVGTNRFFRVRAAAQ